MNDNPTTFCKDCAHLRTGTMLPGPVCVRPTSEISPVTGKTIHVWRLAEVERCDKNACGPRADYFVALPPSPPPTEHLKPSLWQRFIRWANRPTNSTGPGSGGYCPRRFGGVS